MARALAWLWIALGAAAIAHAGVIVAPGDLVVGQGAGDAILRVDPVSGAQTKIGGNGALWPTYDVAVDQQGPVYALFGDTIVRIQPQIYDDAQPLANQTPVWTANPNGTDCAFATGFALAGDGTLYAACGVGPAGGLGVGVVHIDPSAYAAGTPGSNHVLVSKSRADTDGPPADVAIDPNLGLLYTVSGSGLVEQIDPGGDPAANATRVGALGVFATWTSIAEEPGRRLVATQWNQTGTDVVRVDPSASTQ